jgi:hypothetical protein
MISIKKAYTVGMYRLKSNLLYDFVYALNSMLNANCTSPLSITINRDTRILLEPAGNSNNTEAEVAEEEVAEALHSMPGEWLHC